MNNHFKFLDVKKDVFLMCLLPKTLMLSFPLLETSPIKSTNEPKNLELKFSVATKLVA